MNRRHWRWLAAIMVCVAVLDAVVVWAWTAVGWWVVLGVVSVVMAGVTVYAGRLLGVLGRFDTSVRSVILVLVAALLPRREARSWLPELAGQLDEVGAEPARWRAIRSDALRSVPLLLRTAWAGWLWNGLMAAAVRHVRPRVDAIDRVQRSPIPPWPGDSRQTRTLRKRLRTLRWSARLLVWSAGPRQESELVTQAGRLITLTTRARHEIGRCAHQRRPDAPVLALLLELNHTTMVVAAALAQHGDEHPPSQRSRDSQDT